MALPQLSQRKPSGHWARQLPHDHSPTTQRPIFTRSNDTIASAASFTSISRSHDTRPVSGTHRGGCGVSPVSETRRRRDRQRGGAARVHCVDMDAPFLVAQRLPKSVKLLERHDHVWMRGSAEDVTLSFNWD